MAATRLHTTTRWITAAALRYPHHLVEHVMDREGCGRPAARRVLSQLVSAGWLIREGTTRQPTWRPGLLRQFVHGYALRGLAEDRCWQQDVAPFLDLPRPISRLLQHAHGELLNNAVDHSGGEQVTVSLRLTPSHAQLMVSDDGLGLFEQLRRSFDIDDARVAMLELAKGKLSSQPERHTGRGLHGLSRLADVFDVQANGAAFQHRGWEAAGWHDGRPSERRGTTVYVSFSLESDRTLDGLLADASHDGEGRRFDATVVPLHLLCGPQTMLDSRAQARRVAARLPLFRRVALDFSGVDEIGPAFADELFRVLPALWPDRVWDTTHMNAAVARRVEAARSSMT